MTASGPTFSILTLGCKVNRYESQAIRERLADIGWREDASAPRLLVINSCAVTARAEAKARKLIRRSLKEHPRSRLILTGCGLRYSRLRGRDLEELVPPRRRGVPPFPLTGENLRGVTYLAAHTRPLVKIQDGCDAFCSYCVIPLVRGRPASRPAVEVLEEVSGLAAAGYGEIVLTGINLGRWQDGGLDLADLVREICRLPGEFRLRLSSLEPGAAAARLEELLARENRLCPHLHLPLQSGSDRVLKKMNRPYTLDGYRDLVSRLRDRVPDLALTTDCLVGFPGETDTDFKLTCRAVEDLGFSRVHIFPYSPRPLTRASLSVPLPIRVIRERAATLGEIAARSARRYRERFRGETVEVLAETVEPGGRARGLERHYLKTTLEGSEIQPGGLYRGRVTGIAGGELRAEPIGG